MPMSAHLAPAVLEPACVRLQPEAGAESGQVLAGEVEDVLGRLLAVVVLSP